MVLNLNLVLLLAFMLISCSEDKEPSVYEPGDNSSSSNEEAEISSSSSEASSSSIIASSSSSAEVDSSSSVELSSSSEEEVRSSSSESSSSSSAPSSSSAKKYEYCVYASTEYCMPFGSMDEGSKCPGAGVLSFDCPYREIEATGVFEFTGFDYGTNIYYVGTNVRSKITNTLVVTGAECGAITIDVTGGSSAGTVTARAIATCDGTERILRTITARMVYDPFIQVQCNNANDRPLTFKVGKTTVEFSCSQYKDDYYISCEGSNNFSLEIEGYSSSQIIKNGGDNGYNLPTLATVQGRYPKEIVVTVSGNSSIKCGMW
ncbi:MAG: hypothetical protein FWB90_01570 [Fibromonadales bacterium]|nr:hypothetical protein [Fibromonadales bacterium]